jgi:hypothetical protein
MQRRVLRIDPRAWWSRRFSSDWKTGSTMVDYYTHIKNAEIDRFQAEAFEWEQRKYFEVGLSLKLC